ncbi:putative ribonuclease H-like domain-containing protein [Tanacetum coccineum]
MMKNQTMKMHQILKEEYDIWAMEMEHYLEYIDNDAWKVIQNGNSKKRISTRKDGVIRILPPVTAAEIQAVEKERKAKNILLMAIPKEHMRRFHGMDDAKEIWEAIRTRFGGNANSKKMQKAVFKQQFEAFTISSSEGLEKGYDRFQQLLSQLEAHGAEVSNEDANYKFLRSLPPAWSNLAMTMRTKPDVDTLSIDDLYNNLRVFEQEIQGASKTSSSAQNVAFVSQSKSSTNKVKSGFTGAYSTCTPSTSSTNISEKEVLAGFADEVIYSLFAKQSEDWDLLHEDLEQIDDLDIEEMDINWQIAMIAIRMKKFYKKTGRRVRVDGKTPVGFDKKKLECFNCHNTGHFARECTAKGTHDGKKKRDSFYQHQEAGKQEKNQMGLLTMDDGIVNWGEHTEVEETNHALMAISSSSEVSLCSKTCIDSYNTLKTLCDEQMNQLGDQEAQILAYSQAVKKLEAQLVTFQKQQLSLNEKLAFQIDSWKESSKNLWRLINSGMSSNDKLGLGFEIQSNDEVLSYEEEMNFSVFKCSKEDSIGKPSYSRFTKTNDFKGVPPPLSGDYTPKPQEEIDDALYVYGKKGPQKPEISVSDENSSEHSTCQSNDSEGSCENTSEHSFETESESLDEPNEMSKSRLEVTNEKDVSAPNSKEVAPSCVSHIKSPRQPLKDNETHKVNRKSWNDMMKRELGEGYSFTKKKCFVCGSLSHLIKDCDYYEKKMAREAEVKRVVNTGNGVTKPVWTNANRINHSNNFVPRSVQLNTGRPKEHPLKNHGSKGYISGKGRIRVGNLDFDSVSFVKELGHFNLFSISQICDKQHKVLFTETECLVVSSDFKMPDENQILLKVPRHHNMYSFDMKTPSPAKGFACLIAKATSDESKLWHRRLGHINFKNLNKLVKGNLVRGLPSKVFKYDHTCATVACHKGKQHRASCKAKLERLITKPLHTLHMDLFGPTSVKSINHASYCLVITDDCTRFCWVFFLASKDETSGILQTFIRQIENQLSHRVKIIRSDNGTEFKNRDMLEFCGNKGIKQEYSNARTPQQNGVAERMNRTLIEAARTMLADSLLPTTFWAEAVSTACYIFNRVRVTKPQHKTPYELLFGHKPIISYIRPFGCHVTILDTLSVLGKFDRKSDEGFLVGESANNADEEVELIVVPSAVKIPEEKDESRATSKNLKPEETLTEPQTEMKDSLTNHKIQAFRNELEEIAPKAFRDSPENNTTSTYYCYYLEMKSTSWNEGDWHKWVLQEIKEIKGCGCEDKLVFVAQGYTQEEGIDYDEVFALVARIEAIRLFLAFASFMGFIVYQMDVKSAFLYGTIDEELRYSRNLDLVNVMLPSLPWKPCSLTKDEEAFDVDVHLYRSMIGSLMYAVCVCSRFQVTPKTSHLNAVKRIFKYLKGKPHLGLWYPRESPFDLEAFSDSDYGGSNLDRKSTTGGCQFLGQRLISWQCKKQTIVATSTTEAEYVAAANCCGQVLWVKNQLLDYGFNFMNTKIHIDNESTIYIMKNPVYHSKTKHIEIRHYFLKIVLEKKHHKVEKVHTAK